MILGFLMGLAAGLANTAHCLGMCGGFPLHLSRSQAGGRSSVRLVLFIAGKTCTYVFLGSVAGAFGVILMKSSAFAAIAPAMGIGVGVITVLFGLLMLGFRLPPFKSLQSMSDAGFVRSMFGGLLVSPGHGASLALGLAVGFVPCPLPIGMLVVSAASHNVVYGMLVMAGVGIGTAPGLLAAGLLGFGVDRRFAGIGRAAIGILVLAVGMLTLARATGMMPGKHPVSPQPDLHKTAPTPSCCGGGHE